MRFQQWKFFTIKLHENEKQFFTCSLPIRRLNQPMCFNSPSILAKARFASSKAVCVVRAIAECNALNQIKPSCGSDARKIHEWIPSGEWSSMQRFSVITKKGNFSEKGKLNKNNDSALNFVIVFIYEVLNKMKNWQIHDFFFVELYIFI